MGATPSRPQNFAKPGYETSGGPGQYDPAPQYDFGKEVKSFTIGEKKYEKVEYDNRDYSPVKPEKQFKFSPRTSSLNMTPCEPSRPRMLNKTEF